MDTFSLRHTGDILHGHTVTWTWTHMDTVTFPNTDTHRCSDTDARGHMLTWTHTRALTRTQPHGHTDMDTRGHNHMVTDTQTHGHSCFDTHEHSHMDTVHGHTLT